MARFYATMQGNRGAASRMGTPTSGLTAHARGWHVGCRASLSADGDTDVVNIDGTGGSSGGTTFPIATLRHLDGVTTVTLYDLKTRRAKRTIKIT